VNKWVFVALLTIVLSVWSDTSQYACAKRPYPTLKGLNKLKLDVSVSEDVRVQLIHAGAPNLIVGSDLRHEAETKLKEAGISIEGGSADISKLAITAGVDMSTDEFALTVACYEPVSLLRDPSTKFETKVWSKSGHPQTDEFSGLKTVLDDLIDQFIADRAEANPAK